MTLKKRIGSNEYDMIIFDVLSRLHTSQNKNICVESCAQGDGRGRRASGDVPNASHHAFPIDRTAIE